MSTTTLQDDLAFLRALADADIPRRQQALFGRLYFGAGVIYGAQTLASLAMNAGLFSFPGGDGLLSLGATGVFVPWLIFELRRHRGLGAGTVVNKAVNAAFAAVGAANLTILAIVVIAAVRLQEPKITLLIPCIVFALQGAAWFVAFLLRRRAWLGLVAAGWAAIGVALAATPPILPFIALIGFGILSCMALPGYLMMRLAARPEA